MAKKRSTPTEQITVQDRILKYAEEIGWTVIDQSTAETWRKFDTSLASPKEKARRASLFFDDIVYEKVKAFNPGYNYPKADLVRTLGSLPSDISGNRDFLACLRGQKTFYQPEQRRELNLKLIDFEQPENNTYQVTEEYSYCNGQYMNRADVVFLINGIPVLIFENKNATVDEAIAIGVDQLRRYHNETPEMMIPQQIFSVTESLGFCYGVTWSLNRRNLFNWKHEEVGNLEKKVKSFCEISRVLELIRNYILFAEKDGDLNKYILKQHQMTAVEKVVERAHDPAKKRGLVWHTQGSGKTYTIIKSAEMLFLAPKSEKPTILLLLDRNELEDQMMRNLESLHVANVVKAEKIDHLNDLLEKDYRGIIVCMMHKFRGMKADINQRKNIYVLIDEAHRTTGGDLGIYLMAAVPNATFVGFTGTPIDKTVKGKGTFKTFSTDDPEGHLHKYSIKESIEDGTTLGLYYSLAPNELVVPSDILEEEFLKLAETEGISDFEELNRILEKAVRTKAFLKADERVKKVAKYVADHYTEHVEPLGFKAFLVGVDREACALYKQAIDKHLPDSDYARVVYTPMPKDSELMKSFHLAPEEEKKIRKDFANIDSPRPKILIVTEKLLTGFDAPCLYAMYLDKPMRDHTLLQAIARVNRPYEDDDRGMKKPHGFVLDFIGLFNKLKKALSFDSDVVSAAIRNIDLLKNMFSGKMEKEAPKYLSLAETPFTDKTGDKLIQIFRDKSRRKEFLNFYRQMEMLYEIISPDPMLRPHIGDYRTLSAMYAIVEKAYSRKKKVYADKEFMRKTEKLIRENVDITDLKDVSDVYEIDAKTLTLLRESKKGDDTKIINLVKSIRKEADDHPDDPYALSMKQKAEAIQGIYEDRQEETQKVLKNLTELVQQDLERRKKQAQKNFDSITWYFYSGLEKIKVKQPDKIIGTIKNAFTRFPNWRKSESELRDLKKDIYCSILENDDSVTVDAVVEFVNEFFDNLFSTSEN